MQAIQKGIQAIGLRSSSKFPRGTARFAIQKLANNASSPERSHAKSATWSQLISPWLKYLANCDCDSSKERSPAW